MIRLLSYSGIGEETLIILNGAEEENFLNILAARLIALDFDLFIEEEDSLTPYEDYQHES